MIDILKLGVFCKYAFDFQTSVSKVPMKMIANTMTLYIDKMLKLYKKKIF